MAKKKLHKSKTNFTLKRLHQSGNYGKIFERDYMTITNTGASPNGQIPVYSSPSFKFTIGSGYNGQKLYKYGNWLVNNADCANASNKIWTLGCMPVSNKKDSKIILKPNSKKLTDFACYGSAMELIRATLTNIISNFPAELYFTGNTLVDMGILVKNNNIPEGADIKEKVTNGSDEVYMYKDYILIDNPLLIDITQKSLPEEGVFNDLRYFCKSFDKYEIIYKNNTTTKIKSWDVKSEEYYDNCIENGTKLATITITIEDTTKTIEILCFYYEEQLIFISNNVNIVSIRPNQKEIDEYFNKLNDFEKVLLNQYTNYTAKFETYIEDDEGGWKILEKQYQWPVTKGNWNLSVNGIKYDEYRDDLFQLALACDELYSNAIWRDMTHDAIKNMDLTLYKNGELVDFTLASKIQKLLNIIGRQFDEIKKYIDNIKYTNNISYTQDNTPDYFLTDNLELSGWETKEILNEVSKDIIIENFYDKSLKGFTATDANNEFLRRLFLNSSHILSKKGTKQAIEDLMSLFGFHTVDWYNKYKSYHFNDGSSNDFIAEDDIEKLETINNNKLFTIREFVYIVNEPNGTNKINIEEIKGINILKKSYNLDDINSDKELNPYDGLPIAELSIVDDNGTEQSCIIPWFNRELTYDGDLYFQSKGGWSKFNNMYEKTVSNIHYVNNYKDLEEMPINTIDLFGIYYIGDSNEYYQYENNSWTNITNDVNKINEFLNIVDDNKGNNPHNGDYDDGDEYISVYKQFFKYSEFDENVVSSNELTDKDKYGFNIKETEDTLKCHYFIDSDDCFTYDNDNRVLRKYTQHEPYEFGMSVTKDKSKKNELNGLRVINVKKFKIEFPSSYKEFILNDVLPYLKQIIPSTSIFEYEFKE